MSDHKINPSTLLLDDTFLSSEALMYLAPPCQSLKSKRELIRSRFLNFTRNSKLIQNSTPRSGYYEQTIAQTGLKESQEAADDFKSRGIKTLLVLGIGGSSLGAKCVYESLKFTHPLNEVVFLENLDPMVLNNVLSNVTWSETGVALITKAGGTIETLAQFSVIFELLKTNLGVSWKNHFMAITDPKSGSLRHWVKTEGLKSLEVPSDVGGRFSVFTPVGLFPLSFAGIDTNALIEGACDMLSGTVVDLDKLEALSLRTLDLYKQGFDTHVIMPYSTALKSLGEWSVQLIGESLGKKQSPQKSVGITPVAAVGATDQHSLLQLLMEGPQKFVTHFVEVQKWPDPCRHMRFETLPPSFESLSFAFGKPLYEILNKELESTQKALCEMSRGSIKITLEQLNARSLGALLAFYMDYVSYVGAGLEINPYDQPGVELGKKILKELF